MKSSNKKPSKETQLMLQMLKKAAVKAIETKQKLGQYAVIWKDGKVTTIGEDCPKDNR